QLVIVGIGRPRGDLLVNEHQDQAGIFLTPAFARHFASKISYEGAAVKLRDPARDLAPFETAARDRVPDLNLDFQSTGAASAALASWVFPLGRARLAEPSPGLRLDWLVLGVGLPVIVAVLVVPSALFAWRAAHSRRDAATQSRPSRLAERFGRSGGPVRAVSG